MSDEIERGEFLPPVRDASDFVMPELDEYLRLASSVNLHEPDDVDHAWVSRLLPPTAEGAEPVDPIKVLKEAAGLIQEFVGSTDAEDRRMIAYDFYDVIGIGGMMRRRSEVPAPQAFTKSARAQVMLGIDPLESIQRNNFVAKISGEQWHAAFSAILEATNSPELTAAALTH